MEKNAFRWSDTREPSELTHPLLKTGEIERDNADSLVISFPKVKVLAYDELEETTCIEQAVALTSSPLKRWLVTPLLSIVTLLIFPVFLYWKIGLQKKWLYRQASTLEEATHLYIEGKDANLEIVEVQDFARKSAELLNGNIASLDSAPLSVFFTYRFINFAWIPHFSHFEPIKFDCNKPYDELRA
jgi:hypothetical protein